jgi:hypothetical protein
MPFIGQQPITGAYHKLDSITTSATATYNLQLNGGAYSPTSANHLLVSLNGVMQAPQDSFTVSGSQITFASALTSSDNIDFIMALGDVLDIGVPSDGTVNTSQLANSAVTTAKIGASQVTDAKIAGMSSSKLTGDIPDASFPTGSVIQTLVYGYGGYTTTGTPTAFTNSVTLTLTSGQTQVIGSGTITPKFSTSKILVSGHNVVHNTNTGYTYMRIMRTLSGSDSIILTPGNAVGFQLNSGVRISIPFATIDAPNTTNELTYSHRVDYHGGTVNQDYNYGSASLVLMEIAQ